MVDCLLTNHGLLPFEQSALLLLLLLLRAGGGGGGGGLPWKEPGTQGKIGPFALPSLVSSIFLFNFAESIVSFFGIGESALRYGVVCERVAKGGGGGGFTPNDERWALAVSKAFFVAYVLPEMMRGSSIDLLLVLSRQQGGGQMPLQSGSKQQPPSPPPLTMSSNRGRVGFFWERGMKGGWRGGGVDKVPLERRLSVQQVRDLLPFILQRVCARYPAMSRILLSFDPRTASFTSIVNINGIALIQAVTANLWRMMEGEKERLVLYAMEDDDNEHGNGVGTETTTTMQPEVACMLSGVLRAVTDLVPDEKVAAFPTEGLMGKWAAMRSLSLVLMGTHHHHHHHCRGKDNGGEQGEEGEREGDDDDNDGALGGGGGEAAMSLLLNHRHLLHEEANDEDWMRRCCCTELPIPTAAHETFHRINEAVAKGRYAEGVRLVAGQAKYVAYHDMGATMARSDVLNPPDASAVIALMSKLSMACAEDGMEESEWGIRTLEEHNAKKQREQEKLREELPVGMAIGLYLRTLANALRGEARRIDEVSGGASHVWQQDEKLWCFLGAGVLDLAVSLVGVGGSSESGGNRKNLCLVEHDPVEKGDREATVARIRTMLPFYVRNTSEYVQGQAPLPYLFLTPHRACFSAAAAGRSMVPDAREVVKEMRSTLERRAVVVGGGGGGRCCFEGEDADRLEVVAEALALTEGVRVWGPALQDFLLRVAEELDDKR